MMAGVVTQSGAQVGKHNDARAGLVGALHLRFDLLADVFLGVVNNAQEHIGQQVEAQVQSTHQTGAGIIVFADLRATLGHDTSHHTNPATS